MSNNPQGNIRTPQARSKAKVINMVIPNAKHNVSNKGMQRGNSIEESSWKKTKDASQEQFTKGLGITIVPVLALTLSVAIAVYVVVRDDTRNMEVGLVPVADKKPSLQAADVERHLVQPFPGKEQKYTLEDFALRIVKTETWSEQDILQVALAWQKYSANQQQYMRETVWFQLLENGISKRFREYNKQDSLTIADEDKKLLLLGLVKSLGISVPQKSKDGNSKIDKMKSPAQAITSQPIHDKVQIVTENKPSQLQVVNVIASKKDSTDPGFVSGKENEYKLSSNASETMELGLGLPQKPVLTSSLPVTPPDRPTAAQLETITTQFVDAYESGDIAKFTALFTLDASSNNQNSLSALKAEYGNLFAATEERQMFLQNLKWSYSNNKAVGKAKLKVIVISEAAMHTYAGRIQFIVEKQHNEVLISRLFHLVD